MDVPADALAAQHSSYHTVNTRAEGLAANVQDVDVPADALAAQHSSCQTNMRADVLAAY
jgi:hypothetical protein